MGKRPKQRRRLKFRLGPFTWSIAGIFTNLHCILAKLYYSRTQILEAWIFSSYRQLKPIVDSPFQSQTLSFYPRLLELPLFQTNFHFPRRFYCTHQRIFFFKNPNFESALNLSRGQDHKEDYKYIVKPVYCSVDIVRYYLLSLACYLYFKWGCYLTE